MSIPRDRTGSIEGTGEKFITIKVCVCVFMNDTRIKK